MKLFATTLSLTNIQMQALGYYHHWTILEIDTIKIRNKSNGFYDVWTCDSPGRVLFYNTDCKDHKHIPVSPHVWPPHDGDRGTKTEKLCHKRDTGSGQDQSSANLSHKLHPDFQMALKQSSPQIGLKFRISKTFIFQFLWYLLLWQYRACLVLHNLLQRSQVYPE